MKPNIIIKDIVMPVSKQQSGYTLPYITEHSLNDRKANKAWIEPEGLPIYHSQYEQITWWGDAPRLGKEGVKPRAKGRTTFAFLSRPDKC